MNSYKITRMSEALYVGIAAKKLAKDNGFSDRELIQIAISVSELATNIIKYCGYGEIELSCEERVFQILAMDKGPGIKNVDKVFMDHHSDTKHQPEEDLIEHNDRDTGLPAVKRLMDTCEIITGYNGTVVIAEKKRSPYK